MTEQSEAGQIATEQVVTEQGSLPEPCQQYLSFWLHDEEYALDILCVQELRGWCRATVVPESPAFMCGVINLRGDIIPVIDLRCCFGLPAIEHTAETVVIVLRAGPDERVLGVVVDAMSETCELPAGAIVSAPAAADGVPPEYVQGLATLEERMLVVLDARALLAMPELTGLGVMDEESCG